MDSENKIDNLQNIDNITIIDYDLGPEDGINDHDQVCVSQASRLLQIGYLEYETAVYGSAYYKNGEINYYISAKDETMDKFQHNCLQENIYPTPAKYFFKRYDLVQDTEEEVKTRFRLDVARSLQKSYPPILFEAIHRLTSSDRTNTAFPIMQELCEQLNSCFDLNQLNLFGNLTDTLFCSRLLTKESYILLHQWLTKEYEKITVEPIASGDYRRTYAGFAYKKLNGTIQYFIDALPYMAKEKHAMFLAQGCICTPILTITYYADTFNTLQNAHDTFKMVLEKYLDTMYIRLMELFRTLPSSINQTLYFDYLEKVKAYESKSAVDTFLYYGHLWNVKF